MDKYVIMERFHCDHRLQIQMYDFIFVNLETMKVEDYFTAITKIVEKYNKCQLQDQSQIIFFDSIS